MNNSLLYPYQMYNMPSSMTPNIGNTVPTSGAPIKVNGLESAKQYSMTPNSTVVLFDANEDVFYLKKTDASNYPSITTYSFQELKSVEKKEPEYLTIEEFNRFKEELLSGKQYIWSRPESISANDAVKAVNGERESSTNAAKLNKQKSEL